MDGSPVYAEDMARLGVEVFRRCNSLYDSRAVGATPEEEGLLCLSLLWGYTSVMYDTGDKQRRIGHLLDRCRRVLDQLPPSLLKARLLACCYGETYDPELAAEAHAIIATWDSSSLTEGQVEVIETLQSLEEAVCMMEGME